MASVAERLSVAGLRPVPRSFARPARSKPTRALVRWPPIGRAPAPTSSSRSTPQSFRPEHRLGAAVSDRASPAATAVAPKVKPLQVDIVELNATMTNAVCSVLRRHLEGRWLVTTSTARFTSGNADLRSRRRGWRRLIPGRRRSALVALLVLVGMAAFGTSAAAWCRSFADA